MFGFLGLLFFNLYNVEFLKFIINVKKKKKKKKVKLWHPRARTSKWHQIAKPSNSCSLDKADTLQSDPGPQLSYHNWPRGLLLFTCLAPVGLPVYGLSPASTHQSVDQRSPNSRAASLTLSAPQEPHGANELLKCG